MYPYLARRPVPYDPPREFAEAFSAFLSYPRKPYHEFMQALTNPDDEPKRPKRRTA
jgi:hypothetical protein